MVAGTGYDSKGRYVGRPPSSKGSGGGSGSGSNTIKGIKSPAQQERARAKGYAPSSPGSTTWVKTGAGTTGRPASTSATDQRTFETLEKAKQAGAENVYMGSGGRWYESGALLQPPPHTLAYSRAKGYYKIDIRSGDKRVHTYLSESQASKMQTRIESAYARPAPRPEVSDRKHIPFLMPWEIGEPTPMPKQKLPYDIEKHRKGREVITVSYRENLLDASVQERVKLGLPPYRRSRLEKGGISIIPTPLGPPVIVKNIELERARKGAYAGIKDISKIEYKYAYPVAQHIETKSVSGVEGLMPGITGVPRFYESRFGVGAVQTAVYLPTSIMKMPASVAYSIDQPVTATKEYGIRLGQQFKARPIETIGGVAFIAMLGYGVSKTYTKYSAKEHLTYTGAKGRLTYTDTGAIGRSAGRGTYKYGFTEYKFAKQDVTFTSYFKQKGTVVVLHEAKYGKGVSAMTYTPIKFSSQALHKTVSTGWYKRAGLLAKPKPLTTQTLSSTYYSEGMTYGFHFTGKPLRMPTTIGVSRSKAIIDMPVKHPGIDWKITTPDIEFYTYQAPYTSRLVTTGTYSKSYSARLRSFGTHKTIAETKAVRFPTPPIRQTILYKLEAQRFSQVGAPMKSLYPKTAPGVVPKGKLPAITKGIGRTRYDFSKIAPQDVGVGVETVRAGSTLEHLGVPADFMKESSIIATLRPQAQTFIHGTGTAVATAVSPALILKPKYKQLKAQRPKVRSEPLIRFGEMQKTAPITVQAPLSALGTAKGVKVTPITIAPPIAPPTYKPPTTIPITPVEIEQIPRFIVPPIPSVGKPRPAYMKKKKPAKPKKKRRRPDISPLADLLSVTQTEATGFTKAIHLPKTKAVKTKYDIEFKGRGATMRFPTLQMKKRGIKT